MKEIHMRNYNPILDTDSYKQSHYLQYPPGATRISSYIEARGGKWNTMVFHGLQRFLDEYLSEPVRQDHVDQAAQICSAHSVPFNREGWEYIVNQHGGYLPLEVRALPEGTVLPYKNALVQVVNTDPNVPWLTSFIETALLRAVWYPTTVATQSYNIRERIRSYLEISADTTNKLPFMLNDFGARGVSSLESAEIGGVAHLLSFMGTDNLPAILAAQDWYAATDMPGFSVPAAEHSTMTSWGRDREADAYRNMIEQFGGEYPLISVVSDSYDIFNAVDNIWGVELKQLVEDSGSTLVVRPDSGEIIPTLIKVLNLLSDRFGTTENSKGYKVLADCVRIIQGDGINYDTIDAICQAVIANGYSLDNIVFGMGGALLQGVNRDTQQFAMKANAIEIDGEWMDVYKNPIGGSKTSKRGRQAVVRRKGQIQTVRADELKAGEIDLLETVYQNGQVTRHTTLAEIRDRMNSN
jgi:nicotinamide phosphoribosyltransferase